MFGNKARRIRNLERTITLIQSTTLALSINGDDIIGPLNLEDVALMAKYGGYGSEDGIVEQISLSTGGVAALRIHYQEPVPPVVQLAPITVEETDWWQAIA